MKKQKKQLVILIVLLAVCVVGYVMLNRYETKKQEEEAAESEAETIFETDVSQIVNFSYVVDGVTYHYEKEDDQWKCEEAPETDLDESQITSLLSDLSVISCDQILGEVEDQSAYGMDEPSNVITFQTEDGAHYTITIGDYNSTAYCYYYMTSLSDDIYAGNASVCTAFIYTPDNYEVIETESEVSEDEADASDTSDASDILDTSEETDETN